MNADCAARHARARVLLGIFAGLLAGPAAWGQATGLLREFYTGIPGNDVAALTSAPTFPDDPAFEQILTGFFETGPDEADNYGQRIRGYLSPPQTGDYVFWIASDDQSVLYLSPDDNPDRKRAIASVNGATGFRAWFNEPNQQSVPVHLEAGELYYVEVLHKEGGGGDHVSVRWALPSGAIEEPIPTTYFLPFGTPIQPPTITRQPASITVVEGESATFLVQVSNADPLIRQWQRDNAPIPGATGSSYTIQRVQLSDHGAQFRVTLQNSLGVVVSEAAVLTVLPDTVAPMITSAFNASLTNVVVRFSEPVGTSTALVATNYALDHGASVTSVVAGRDSAEVVLGTAELVPGTTYTLSVSRVTDRAATPNPIAPGSSVEFVALTLGPVGIGNPPQDGVVQPVPGGLDITAVGRGLGGTNDQVHFSYQQRTGDFDVQVRLDSLQMGGLFSQAGLMVRQNLTARSPFAASLATPSLAGSSFHWRGATGAVAQAEGSFPVNYPETWLRLRRAGTNFTGYASYDGVTWSRLGSANIAMTNTVYLGLVVGSRSTNVTALAAFRDFKDVEAVEPASALPLRVEPLGPSSRRTGLVISEIMYHPPDRTDGRQLEYIEIFNGDSVFVDLSGFQLSGDIQFVFPPGTILPAGAYLVVAQSPGDLQAEYGLSGVLGPWTGRLPRGSGLIALHNRHGALLLEIEYTDEAPWPVAADGAGHSLVLVRPSYGEGDVRAWSASARRGGSPGRAEVIRPHPLEGVRINEVLARTSSPVLDFMELYNHRPAPVDLSGCVLTDDALEAKFRIPEGTILQPGGFIAWDETQLGFGLSGDGEAVYLIDAAGEVVIDAVRFGPQMAGVASGRTPDGADSWLHLAGPTPGGANTAEWYSDIIINELMYHPPAGEHAEFVELFNRGDAPVNLRDWQLGGGITFAFTSDVVLAPGGYLVVAADATYLRTVHPNLDPVKVVGNFDGSLRDSGERILLARPELVFGTDISGNPTTNRVMVTVDEVTYVDGGRWGRWSDGGGSSLELIDPRADNRLAANWADSDESGKAPWVNIDFSGLLELGQGAPSELQIMLLGAGECLLDNIQVIDQGGANLVPNSGFDGGLSGWIAQGNHVKSGLSTNGYNSQRGLYLRASSGGDNGANRIKTALNGFPSPNGFATFRGQARWLRGHPDLLMRLKGNYLETLVHLEIPENLGTPGAPNSRAVANAGPAIYDVTHVPVLPAALEPVTVTARIHDPDRVRSAQLRFRYDPSLTVQQIPMRDDGSGGDAVARDGIYTAVLPGQAAGVLVAFRIEAMDDASSPATATFPDLSLGECLVRFGDAIPAGSFGTYRLWMTQANTDTWEQREVLSNEALDGTIVYGSSRVIYNGSARYRGSPFIRPNYTGPMGSLCGYIWEMPKDDELFGSDEFNLDWLEQPGRDPTLQRERISFWIGDQLGATFSHTRYVQVYVNGMRRGLVYTDSQQPNRDYVGTWFPESPDGEIFKIDDWFEFDDSVAREFNVDATLQRFANSQGRVHKTRYRWNWEKKANGDLDDDYTPLLDLVEALNIGDETLYTQRVQQLVDPDGWLRSIATRRVVADWDGYGYDRGKNTFAYLPTGGRWNLMLWDLDFSLGGGSDGATTDIFFSNDPTMERMYQNPFFGRVYLQAIADAVRGPLSMGAADAIIDANYEALVGNGIEAASPQPIKSWISARRDFLARLLTTNTAPWRITSNDGADITTSESLVTLTGTAPIEVRGIRVNGVEYAPSWSSRSNWVLQIPLRSGVNRLVLTGVDRLGQPIPNASSAINVEYTGVEEQPEDFVRISEIMYEPPIEPDAEFVEIQNASLRTTFDLSGWRLEGVDYEFPGGMSIGPGQFALVVKDRVIFESSYGPGLPVIGVYPGRLNNAGETLRLVRPGSSSQPFIRVNEVTYSNRLPWPERAEGDGGSLQILDPSQDNRRPANWVALDREGHGYSRWQFVSVTDRASTSLLRISLASPGVVHLDDVSVVAGLVPRVGTELVANGGFEQPLEPAWMADPALASSAIDTTTRRSGNASLRLVASPQGFTSGASLRQTLSVPVVPGEFYTLSFWYLASPSGGDLTVRLDGSGVARTVDALETPLPPATPGAPSSVRATLAPIPDVWINEVFPSAIGGLGETWIELFNGGDTPVSLSGWFLSNDPSHPGMWSFPSGTMIGPGEFLVVRADGRPGGPGELYTSFALTPVNGSVVLARTDGGTPVAVDYLHYEGQGPGRSIGSYPDGAWSQRVIFEVPTPGTYNDITGSPVRLAINEWMARNNRTITDPADGDFDDWFEIINVGTEPVDLTGYSLTDDPEEPRKSVIPPGFILQPGELMLVWADSEPEQNGPGRELHVDFALSADGEAIALFSPGGAIIDLVIFGPQERDVSEGLVPDGEIGSVVRLPSPSPRALNVPPVPGDIRVTAVSFDGAQLTLVWSSVAGRMYQVQFCDALGSAWLDLGSPVVAVGSTATMSDPAVGVAKRFYRVVGPSP